MSFRGNNNFRGRGGDRGGRGGGFRGGGRGGYNAGPQEPGAFICKIK